MEDSVREEMMKQLLLGLMLLVTASLALPIELVHGDADTIVPLAVHARRLAPLIPGAHLTVIPGAGHMPQHSHPETVIAAIHRAAARAGLR